MRKKIMILFMSICLSFSSATFAHAAIKADVTMANPMKVDDQTRQRVYKELLEGKISNEADTIKVALEQYQERLARNRQRNADNNSEVDDSFTITQIVGSELNEYGELLEEVVTTNLLVLDENNNIARTSSFNTSGNGYLSEYSIGASMTVNVTKNTSNLTVRFNSFRTRLTYGSPMTAGSLEQSSWYQKDILGPTNDKTQTFAYPQAGKDYVYIPNNQEMISYQNYGERVCFSTIHCGSRSIFLKFTFRPSMPYPDGEWTTQYY